AFLPRGPLPPAAARPYALEQAPPLLRILGSRGIPFAGRDTAVLALAHGACPRWTWHLWGPRPLWPRTPAIHRSHPIRGRKARPAYRSRYRGASWRVGLVGVERCEACP